MLVLFDDNGRYQGLCLQGVNCTEIPADAVEVSEEDWQLYVQNGCNDYIRGSDGKPQKKPVYQPTTDEQIAAIEAKYQKKIDALDQRILTILKVGGDDQTTKLAAVQAEYTAELDKKDAEILEILEVLSNGCFALSVL